MRVTRSSTGGARYLGCSPARFCLTANTSGVRRRKCRRTRGEVILNTRNPSTVRCANTSGGAGRVRSLRLLLVALAAVVAFTVVPASASAFGISGFTINPSTKQAGSHPNVAISFNRTGTDSEDLREANVELPAGMFQNPENSVNNTVAGSPVRKCTSTEFATDKCPTYTQLGTASTTVKAAGILDLTVPGSIYMLTPANNNAATLGIVMRPSRICILFVFCAQPSKIFLKTAVVVNTFDDNDGLRTYTSNAPKTSTVSIPLVVTSASLTLDITINKLALTFNGKYGPSNNLRYSMVAGTRCDKPSVAKAELWSYQGVRAYAESSYTPTGCTSVPFNPTMSFNPGTTQAGASTTAAFQLNIPQADATIQNSHPKIVDVDFPNGSGIDLPQLDGVTGCTEEQLRIDTCPESSIIGSATSAAPYLPPELTGTVYAMFPVSNQVPMGVVLRGARGTLVIFRGVLGVRGDSAAGTGRTYARFDLIPQLPFANVKVNITKPLYKNPNLSTCGTQTATGNLQGFSGALRTITSTYPLTGCDPKPIATITSGPPASSSIIQPTFGLRSNYPGNSFFCQMDSGPVVPCSENNTSTATETNGSYTAEPLIQGSHTFKLYSVNGVSKSDTVSRTFTVVTDFTITPTITSSTTVAGGHPNLNTSFDIAGGQPKNIQVRLPRGFAASLSSRSPLCTAAQATTGDCPASSRIGQASITASTDTDPVTGVGDAYLTEGPTAADAGGVAVEIPLGGIGTFIAGAGAYLVENGNFQYINIRSIPQTVGSTQINITNFGVNFEGATGRLLTNATNCDASSFQSSGESWSNNPAAVINVAYQSTGCPASPPFNPTVTQTISNNRASASGDPETGEGAIDEFTGVSATVSMPADNGSIKKFEVLEPAALKPNYGAFGAPGDQCKAGSVTNIGTEAAPNYRFTYSAANCPAQALVGTMTINTPLLPTPLVGQVYLVNRSPLPWLGVKFDAPGISVRLVGVTDLPSSGCDITVYGYCPPQIKVTFDNIVDTPITSVSFVLDGPDRVGNGGVILSGKVLGTASDNDPVCLPNVPAQTTITSWSGTVRTSNQNIPITGCLPAP